MANRSYLYSTNIPPGPNAVTQGRKLVGISEYAYDVPIVFKLLLSADTRSCPSSIWDSDGDTALMGDYDVGVAKLRDFFAQIEEPAAQVWMTQALEFLNQPENRNPYFVLECGEIFEMGDMPDEQQNQRLQGQIQNLQPEIDAALQAVQQFGTAAPLAPQTAPKKPGFLARFFGLAPSQAPARSAPDPMQPIRALGLGYWSNYLYFDFSDANAASDKA